MKINTLAFILSLSSLIFIAGCEEKNTELKPAIRPVKSMVIESIKQEETRSFPGKLEAAKKVNLAFQVSGVLNQLPVIKGQSVEEGQIVAQVDQSDFKSNLNAATASYNKSQADYDRGRQIFAKKLLSKADLDKLRATRDVNLSELEKARKAFKDTTLMAPFSGVVADIYIENFEDVAAKSPIMTLQDATTLEISIQVPEHLLVKTSAETTEALDIFAQFESVPDQKFRLTIKEYSTKADPQTQTFEYILAMDSPENLNLLPGMTVTVIATRKTGAQQESISVPASAVVGDEREKHKHYIWLVTENSTVAKQSVEVGRITGQRIEILSGLKAGQRIVIAGAHYLRPDQPVRLLDESQEP